MTHPSTLYPHSRTCRLIASKFLVMESSWRLYSAKLGISTAKDRLNRHSRQDTWALQR